MNGIFSIIRGEMLQLINLSAEIAKHQMMLLHCSNLLDKDNYDAVKGEAIRKKIAALETKYYPLKKKWFHQT